jgi:hypothetical protein
MLLSPLMDVHRAAAPTLHATGVASGDCRRCDPSWVLVLCSLRRARHSGHDSGGSDRAIKFGSGSEEAGASTVLCTRSTQKRSDAINTLGRTPQGQALRMLWPSPHGAAPPPTTASSWDATATAHAAKATSHPQERRRGLGLPCTPTPRWPRWDRPAAHHKLAVAVAALRPLRRLRRQGRRRSRKPLIRLGLLSL